jgi:hypothetical protein
MSAEVTIMDPRAPANPNPAQSGPAPVQGELVVVRGTCSALFAYDLGFAIDLNKAQALLGHDVGGTQRETLKHSRRAPKYFEYQPAPIRISRAAAAVTIGRFTTTPAMEALIYDFGAISIEFTIPLQGPIKDLLPLSSGLYENDALLAESRRLVEELVGAIRAAVTKPEVAHLVEDYLVFDIDEWKAPAGFSGTINDWIDGSGGLLARILRSDSESLSQQEVVDAMSCRISYSVEDAALIDWNAALVFGREMQDVLAVLEFANVELLEMRFLDDQLDRALGEAYESSQRREKSAFASTAADMRRIARLQMDSAILFEGVNNALKLLGDPYLSRVYRLAAQRLHLPDWDASIIRKLGTLETIYDKIADRQSGRRMEALEWIIILLIAFELVMSIVRWH